MRELPLILSFCLMLTGASPGGARAQSRPLPQAGPVAAWPRPIPVRLAPEGADDLFVMTLGAVRTVLADGIFDPVADRVTRTDGSVIEHYYRDALGIRWYRPLDKSVFPLPPSGWCSWYFYYQEITADEFLANADWISEQLEPFGARYVQLDDGWQGTGRGLGGNRDWTTIDARFTPPGMAAIAARIRGLGLEAGLWLAPHGQSNEAVARSSGAFLWKPDGTTASDTWEGTYLVDPTLPAAHRYLADLFRRLHGMGYTYFKIDGQPIVLDEFTKNIGLMKGTVPAGEPRESAVSLYRGTLETIRDAIGPDSYLLGCWGIPLEGAGIMNGSRTGGDIIPGWDGFLVAADAVQRWNFLHNIVWYSDPDVLLVRPPLTDGTARAWATIQGLTGQALMASDRMMDLPESRVELLRRIYPAVDIRPLDLFRPRNLRKPVWDLKVDHLGRSYDVVGLFDFSPDAPISRHLTWDHLGLDASQPMHVWDFWNGTYMGAWSEGMFVDVPAADVRVLTLVAMADHPVLLSTSRHITQGWVDLLAYREGSAASPGVSGTSRLVGGDPYTLVFGLPRSGASYQVAGVRAARRSDGTTLEVHTATHQGYATVSFESALDADVDWEVSFETAPVYHFPVTSPGRLQARPEGLTAVHLSWPTEYHTKAGFQVEVDGRPVGIAFGNGVTLYDLEPGATYRFGVRSVWYDGTAGERTAETEYTSVIPSILYLSDYEPMQARQDWGELRRDTSVDGNSLSVAGRTATKGLGTHASSEVAYRMDGKFIRFDASVGVDDETSGGPGSEVVFEVLGDGKRLWRSAVMRTGQQPVDVSVDITGVKVLTLRVLPGSDGRDYDHADWLEARVRHEIEE